MTENYSRLVPCTTHSPKARRNSTPGTQPGDEAHDRPADCANIMSRIYLHGHDFGLARCTASSTIRTAVPLHCAADTNSDRFILVYLEWLVVLRVR